MSSRLHPESESEKEVLMMDPEAGVTTRRHSSSSSGNPDFMLIKIVARIALSVIRRQVQYFAQGYELNECEAKISVKIFGNIFSPSGGSGHSLVQRCSASSSSTGCTAASSLSVSSCSASPGFSIR